MLQPTQVEELIALVCSLDRDGLIREMKRYDTRFPIDFTPQFLREQPIDRLRHIFVAMCLHCQRIPAVQDEPVAA